MMRSKLPQTELGNCCQEWAELPGMMRQHRAQLCINARALCMFDRDTRWKDSGELTRVTERSAEIHLPRQSPSITGAEE